MNFILSWALRRRPMDEEEQLKNAAVASQTNRLHQTEVETMSEAVKQTWDEWMLEKGEVRARQEDLRSLLEERFGNLPDSLLAQIESTTDGELLKSCIRQTLHIQSLDELNL
jgi:hypothetical protein